MTAEPANLCCFRDCSEPPVALTGWGPLCYTHSFRLHQGAQGWYDEAMRLRSALQRIATMQVSAGAQPVNVEMFLRDEALVALREIRG